eukprot:scaffold65124_cov60-Phaeocystis_antarctica.AAC.2
MHTPGLVRLLLSHSSLPRASLGGGRARCGPRIAALHVACELLAKHAGAAVRASRWQLADRHLGDAVADRLVGKQRAAGRRGSGWSAPDRSPDALRDSQRRRCGHVCTAAPSHLEWIGRCCSRKATPQPRAPWQSKCRPC